MAKTEITDLEIERGNRSLEGRTVRFTKEDLVRCDKTPCLNLDDLVEIAAYKPKDADDYLLIDCEPADRPTVCTVCKNSGFIVKNGYTDTPRLVHDVNIGLTQVDLSVRVPKYKCTYCNARPTHEFKSIEFNRQYTKRLLQQIKVEAFTGNFEQVAIKYGLSSSNVGNLFDLFAQELEQKRGKPHVGPWLAIDEKHIVHKARGLLVDGCSGTILELTGDTTPATMEKAIRSLDGYEDVVFVTTDMAVGYRSMIEKIYGSSVTLVVDKWHVLNDLSTKISKCRTNIIEYLNATVPREPESPERRHRMDVKKLAGNDGYLFKYGAEKLSQSEDRQQRLAEICATFPEFNHLRLLKEGFEAIYDCRTRSDALERFRAWMPLVPPNGEKQRIAWEQKYGVPASLYAPIRPLLTTVNIAWNKEIFNYFDSGEKTKLTNAIAEATNSAIARFSSEGYTFSRLRAKVLFGGQIGAQTRYVLETRKVKKPETAGASGHDAASVGYYVPNVNRDTTVDVYGIFEVQDSTPSKPFTVLSLLPSGERKEYIELVRREQNIQAAEARGDKYIDRTGLFKDFGFKLAVISSLLDKENSFKQSLEEMKAQYCEKYEMGSFSLIPEMIAFFENLVLTKEDLSRVEFICFDSRNPVYRYMMPDWDGESEEFYVKSVDDFLLLPNLSEVECISLCDPELANELSDYGIVVY